MTDPQSFEIFQSVEIFHSWDLYDNIVQNNWMMHRQMASVIQKVALEISATQNTNPQLRVLDLGCGDGAMARNGLKNCPVEKYVGVDLSQDALMQLETRQGLGPNVQVLRGDIATSIEELPPEAFDLVLASYSLHHFESAQKKAILQQIRRLLTPTGVLLWIDIARFDREDRSGFIARIEQEVQSRWIPMPSEHRHDAIEPIRNYDFPEQESWMIDTWESNSQNQRSSGNPIEYRDAFYIALRLAAG